MRFVRFLLCVITISLLVGHAHAQEFPRNEVSVLGVWFKQEGIQAMELAGPNQTFTGWNPSSWGIEASYRYWVSPRLGVDAALGLQMAVFTYAWDPGGGVYYPSPYPSEGVEREYKEFYPIVPLRIRAVSRFSLSGNWVLMPSLGFGIAQLGSETINFGYGVSVNETGDTLMKIMQRIDRVNASGKPIYLVELGGELGYKLPNLNTITFALVLQYSARRDIFSGEYTLYPDTEFESRGRYTGGINHVGLRLGYSMSWGSPKEPGYVRKAGRKAERTP